MPAKGQLKTHCNHGHKYTPKNTYITGNGKRYCRKCRAIKTKENLAARRLRYKTDSKFRAAMRARGKANYSKWDPTLRRKYVNKHREKLKREVFTHYGKYGKMQCCWKGCTVCDIDMLSIDHIKNDGAKHRRQMAGNRVAFSGKALYQWLVSQRFPEGFQTLCMNHQVKKQRIKSRAERLDQ